MMMPNNKALDFNMTTTLVGKKKNTKARCHLVFLLDIKTVVITIYSVSLISSIDVHTIQVVSTCAYVTARAEEGDVTF